MKKGETIKVDGQDREVLRPITSLTSDEVIGVVVCGPVEVLDFVTDAARLGLSSEAQTEAAA